MRGAREGGVVGGISADAQKDTRSERQCGTPGAGKCNAQIRLLGCGRHFLHRKLLRLFSSNPLALCVLLRVAPRFLLDLRRADNQKLREFVELVEAQRVVFV